MALSGRLLQRSEFVRYRGLTDVVKGSSLLSRHRLL